MNLKYNYTFDKNNYLTPPVLVQAGLEMAGINIFDCDVCCTLKNIPAIEHFVNGQKDGLKENWHLYNWCNPPFDECNKWIKKAFEEQKKGNSTVMLIPVRTETKYWHDYILFNPKVDIKWLRKGYRFINPDTNEPMGIFKNALALVFFR